ncbi:winged helix-turn-helix transcriptional regulator [Amycolatopsis anabasis]|uniref:winged helix-turn-helix transcriptional regulator n=1 Tax=Amycolatopsis anabasis TaxID=1840409 RepID=UPI00131BB395|nr:helix-turn-helix domain-containing protein [Amycolatopsis anabasis]
MPTGNQHAVPHAKRHPDGIEKAVQAVGDRWSLLIIRECFYGVRRFGEMTRNLGIARKVLATRLKELIALGLLERRRYRTEPDWYEYVLTPAGRDLYGPIAALLHWADRHMPDLGEPVRLHHMPCDHDTHAVVVCAVCRAELDARDVEARLPRGTA